MRRVAAVFSLVFLIAVGGRAFAGVEIVSDQPSASLLLPYFEVNLDNPSGANTLMTINNASATATLAHVVIWSDLSVPSLEFLVYLTGYDVYTLNLGDLFINGILPQTASAGQDPRDTISPKGQLSQDINFASCNGLLPYGPRPVTGVQLTGLQDALTGNASANFGGLCAGVNHQDRIARGYITVDTVNNCTLRFPGDVGYFGAGGTGDATNQNVLWGDVMYINKAVDKAFGQPLVHILASATNPLTSTSGRYTFYGRYDNFTAVDNRQPLSTTFAARFINGASSEGARYFSGGTAMIVWRDSKVAQGPFTCPAQAGVRPSWFPLGQEGIVIFDEQEHPQLTASPAHVFPAETQKVHVGGSALPTTFDAGWMYLDLNTTVAAAGSNPPVDPAAAQAWVSTFYDNNAAGNTYRVGERANLLDSATGASHFVP
jgi:hypothetical protein